MIIESQLFDTYNQISTNVKAIQKSDKKMEDKKSLMSQLRKQHENQLNNYNKIASSFAHSFLKRYQLNDHVIEAKIGSPTPYGNQPKEYLWSGISINEDKSYSFQYSWVFQKDLLEVTFCFGSGGSSSGKIDATVKEKRVSSMRAIEQLFIKIVMLKENKSIIERLLHQENFVLTAEWLNTDNRFPDVDSYLTHISNKTGAKTGITRYFDKHEVLTEDFNLEEKLFHYFDIFFPIWDQLHHDNTRLLHKSTRADRVKIANRNFTKEPPTFKYTMAHLYLGQGIISYLGNNDSRPIPIDELISNQATVLISGDDVKNPKERIQHVGRALQELGQISVEDGYYSLTPQGTEYYLAFDQNKWRLSPQQVQILREYLGEANGEHATNLAKVMNLAISLVEELGTFSLDDFNTVFILAMGLEEEWRTVTQENRSRFMLNWLEELHYVRKSGDQYIFQVDEEVEPLDTLTVSERLSYIKSYIRNKGFHFPDDLIENLYLSLKTKPFVILAGVSGTGKTKLVKLFAEALGALSHNHQFALIPVRPDWSDPSDLLGYKDLSGAFRPGRLAEVLVDASKESNRNKPYFICLDEMNLARVEHYFSDLLSIIETQEWQGDRIVTMPLINKDTLAAEDQPIYGSLSLPENVYLIGTVNMDETTHPFSKKVLDRANTIEFNYINLEQFPDQAGARDETATAQASNAFLRSEYLQLIDAYGEYQELAKKVTSKLVKVNGILEQIHSHVGFRIRDAVCFYMIYNERFSLMSEDAAFDLQLLQKILPRVQGSSSSVKRVLLLLMQEALGKALSVNDMMDDASDLYMKWSASEPEEKVKYPLSARKIAFMLRRLEEDGFTSYWLS